MPALMDQSRSGDNMYIIDAVISNSVVAVIFNVTLSPIILITTQSSLLCLVTTRYLSEPFVGSTLLTEIPRIVYQLQLPTNKDCFEDSFGNNLAHCSLSIEHSTISMWCVAVGELQEIKKAYLKLCLQYSTIK
jgi:hypothetical protein